jgi:phosphoglycerate dehydrogenase-like enzyme
MEVDQSLEGRRPHILIADPIAEEGIDLLQEHADVDVKIDLSREQLLDEIADYDALVVRGITLITTEIIDRGLNLKVIARAGSGLENIDVVAAVEANIEVISSPDTNSVAVAEHTMGLMLSLARRLPRADMGLKEGKWEKTELIGTGLAGKTLGIVGFGRIGREVAVRAQAFGMKILVNQRRPTPELNMSAGVETVDLDDLLRDSDFVTLHVPLSPETEGMIGPKKLDLMKPSAFLINTARGAVIDEPALLQTLNDMGIAGAALDVFVSEPATDSALAQHPRVIATPHIAARTEDAQRVATLSIAQQIIEFFQEVEVESILPLRVVALDRVVPHEDTDPNRVKRLASRLQADSILRDPPVVMAAKEYYVVLDGATRTEALRQLALPHVVVQVQESEDDVDLHAWYHVIQKMESSELVALLDDLAEVSLESIDSESAADRMFEYGGLCYIHTIEGQAYIVYSASGVNRLDALNELSKTYIQAGRVDRTLKDDIFTLQYEYPEMCALVVYPEFSVGQVLHATLDSGRTFPAGITRFLIPGRILRMNIGLDLLESDKSLQEKNRLLHEILLEKQSQSRIRYYGEAVYVLND